MANLKPPQRLQLFKTVKETVESPRDRVEKQSHKESVAGAHTVLMGSVRSELFYLLVG